MSDASFPGPLSDDELLPLLKAARTFRLKGALARIDDVKAQVARLGFKEAYKVWPINGDVKLKFLGLMLE
jgi:hypothetical protein